MIRRQAGQAFILVLILLAIGALLVVPALRLTGSSLKSSQIVTRRVKLLYAADAMQEYVISRLLYDTAWRDANLSVDGATAYLYLDLCGVSVNATVVMRAVPGQGGVTLATDDAIKPTKSVSPNATDTSYKTFTYTIKLEQLSNNNTRGLDVVYDILPNRFSASDYVLGSSELSVDGGPWQAIDDPSRTTTGGQVRLQWPASGNFTSPMRNFNVRQVKEIRFRVNGSLLNNRTYYNWVVLNTEGVITVNGDTGAIVVGNGSGKVGGMLKASKTSNPEIIIPGVETNIEYTVGIINLSDHTMQIQEITDYLPPGFVYFGALQGGFAPTGITTSDPQRSLENLNGVERWKLRWTTAQFPGGNAVSIASGATLYLVFWAQATKNVSGSYYNEVTVFPNETLPQIFSQIGVTNEDLNTGYSWNSGAVVVPAYDSETQAGDVVLGSNLAIDANLALLGQTSMAIISYQIR